MKEVTLHGVFMSILEAGVLLTGPSGIGKSELALGLIKSGYRLIADDTVIFQRDEQQRLIGSCPELLQDFLEVRGLGILNIRAMYGDNAIAHNMPLDIIIDLARFSRKKLQDIDRIHGLYQQRHILGIAVATVTIPLILGRNLAVLVESAVRNFMLKRTGYDASKEFSQRQLHYLTKSSS